MQRIVRGTALTALSAMTLACQADGHGGPWPHIDSAIAADAGH